MNKTYLLLGAMIAVTIMPALADATTCVGIRVTCAGVESTGYGGLKNSALTSWIDLDLSAYSDHYGLLPGIGETTMAGSTGPACNYDTTSSCNSEIHVTLHNVPVGVCYTATAISISAVPASDSRSDCT